MRCPLTTVESEILNILRAHSHAISGDELMAALASGGYRKSYGSVRVAIHKLRKKLVELEPQLCIQTFSGYRLTAAADRPDQLYPGVEPLDA